MNVDFEKLVKSGKIERRYVPVLTAMAQSGFVTHRSWGFGRIKKVDTVFSRMTVDFRGKPGHTIDLGFAAQILKPATAEDDPKTKPLEMQQLSWKLLPPGELNLTHLRLAVQASARRQNKELSFDVSRLEFLLGLNPAQLYAGVDEFDGYLAFLFNGMDGAVLENPMEGNAVYVFDSHWRELSKLTKSELFQQARHKVQRIVHTGDWQSRLKAIVLSR